MKMEMENKGFVAMRNSRSTIASQKSNQNLLDDIVQNFKRLSTIDNPQKRIAMKEERADDILNMPMTFFYEKNESGSTLLITAIEEQHIEAALWLIASAPHPSYLDVANIELVNPLRAAVVAGNSQLVRELAIAGANVRCVSPTGHTLLQEVCASGDLGCMRALLEPFSDEESRRLAENVKSCPRPDTNLEYRDYFGKTCLHIAAARGHAQLIEYLILAGADVNAGDGLAGNTALHIAAQHGFNAVAELLVCRANCRLDCVNYAGLTAGQLALEAHNDELAAALLGPLTRLRRCLSNSSLASDSGFSSSSDDCHQEHD